MTSTPAGVQLWTLRSLCERDFKGTLQDLARRTGCRWIEPYTFWDAGASTLSGWLRDLGMGAISSHVGLARLSGDLDAVARDHEALGCRRIVCPWLEESERQGPRAFERIGERLDKIGEWLAARGFSLAYHNHEFEFTPASTPDGLQRILGAAAPQHLSAQLDVYWAAFAGIDPAAYLRGLGMRASSVHLKDGDLKGGFTPVGEGGIDMPEVIRAGREIGVHAFIVEQDEHEGDPIESVRRSLEYLRGLGLEG